MNRVAFMGIDGSGKTTLMRAVQRVVGDRASLLFSPDFHDIPGFPGAAESRSLTEFSRLVDAQGDPALKLASLYLRMCAFGEAESFLIATEHRPTMCIERHPLIDAITYLQVYIHAVKKSGVRPEDSTAVMEVLRGTHPDVLHHVDLAVERRNGRLGITDTAVEAVAGYCMGFAAFSAEDFARSLSMDFQTTLPDRVLYLDVPPSVAFDRVVARGKALEAHESLENLTRLDRLARSKFTDFERLGVPTILLPVGTEPEAEVVRTVIRHLDGAAA
ncbi:hypothetical protein LBMAG42_31380 [Deltaproteobacteria bacterium]|nr:hypothetical protein LBMAG42_31380 [Deltaproteobacteria bacterium]